jgi:hypothetical protein
MTRSAEPEREIVRRVLPFGPPGIGLALLIGAATAGWNAGWSAAIGAGVVYANALVHGLSLVWAAQVSPITLYAVGLGGFFVRMGVILALLFGLDRAEFFSPMAFLSAAVPATIALLLFEMRLLASGLAQELVIPDREEAAR